MSLLPAPRWRTIIISILIAALAMILSVASVQAQEPDTAAAIQELQARLAEQERRLAEQERQLADLRSSQQQPQTRWSQEQLGEVRDAVAEMLLNAREETGFTSGWDRGFVLRSNDNLFSLNIGGWIQPRYEYRVRPGIEDTSSFRLRRARIDIRGHVFDEKLTYRVLTDMAGAAPSLQDAFINYSFEPGLQVRAGQFTVPFNWHRDVGPRRQHFAERGDPAQQFGFVNGRDAGIMLHGRDVSNRFGYGVGIFDGAGRNVGISNSAGNMASARVSWAALGTLPREESDLAFSEELQLAFGAGLQGAWRNQTRAWDLGRSPAPANTRADYLVGTVDTSLRYKGFSLAADGYLRGVDPDSSAVDSYNGWAYMISSGYFIVPKKYEVVARWSQLQLDSDDSDTRRNEWGLGLNRYLKGHDHKIRFNYFNSRDDVGTSQTVIVEYHLQF